ncbi:MAG: cysteine peptidase family C39 domain-containing protein [Anaerococcus hydrogenalis]|uniref:cysteine peptidase family C39 domain-containing protein n=1 Tax=Anaerococcus hydrogenalis TaxID=33029 RepID=UPI0028FE89E9|nr:cysteine peptidase family C39 domain-containing protein [Anaerococcus hydrogenalis]MDU2583429.1 cysteine peptidase family C39 domain-containing protein [Anaerococcus hydrogenalis]
MKYPSVRQKDSTDCAAACLATICKFYGRNKDIVRVRQYAKTDSKGTNGVGLVKAAQKLGFTISAFSDEKKQLDTNLINYPFIAHILSSIVDSDLIYFMDGGKIISKGSHKDLLRENEFYREMVNNLAISPI